MTCFHSTLWSLLAGSQWCTQVSLPVKIHCRKTSPCSWYCCKNCMHVSTHACLFSSVSCFGTHPAQILIPVVLVDDWICRSTADVQLVDYNSHSNLSVLLNQSTNSFNTAHHSWSGWMAWALFIDNTCSTTLEPFHPLVHLHLLLC